MQVLMGSLSSHVFAAWCFLKHDLTLSRSLLHKSISKGINYSLANNTRRSNTN